MFFTLQNNINVDNTLTINYMNETITNVPSVRFLGLLVDDTFKLGQTYKPNSFKTEHRFLRSVDTYPSAIIKCIKDAILLLRSFNYLLRHNFLGCFYK